MMRILSTERSAVLKRDGRTFIIFRLSLPRAEAEADAELDSASRINAIYEKMADAYYGVAEGYVAKLPESRVRPHRIRVVWRIGEEKRRMCGGKKKETRTKGNSKSQNTRHLDKDARRLYLERAFTLISDGVEVLNKRERDVVDKARGIIIR